MTAGSVPLSAAEARQACSRQGQQRLAVLDDLAAVSAYLEMLNPSEKNSSQETLRFSALFSVSAPM